MKQIMLEGGIKIVTFDPPPQNFDPLTANPAEPEKYGFPAMPDNPHHHERYQKVFRRLKHKLKFVEPIVRVSPGRTLAPGPPAAPDPRGRQPTGRVPLFIRHWGNHSNGSKANGLFRT